MKRLTPDSPELKSADLVAENIERLRELFPEAFANEGKIDFDVLRQLLGDRVDDGEERYGLNWHGKRAARQLALTPSTGTLRPCPEESVNWDTTQNIFIEGDNLEVLKLLQKSYAGKVKLIYIDPPYNTGKDFVYPDNFQDSIKNYLEITGQVEGGQRITSNTEASGRFHTDWLNMMYPRLRLARTLLRHDGLVFISIDDCEASNLRLMLDDLFGEDNFLAIVAWEKRYTRSNNARLFYSLKDTVLVYRKTDAVSCLRETRPEDSESIYANPDDDPRGVWTSSSYVNPATKEQRPNLVYTIVNPRNGERIDHPTHAWKYSPSEHEAHKAENRLWWGQDGDAKYPRLKNFLSEMTPGMVPIDLWSYEEAGTTDEGGQELKELFGAAVFDNPKPTRLIRRVLGLFQPEDCESAEPEIVLDFFSGSGSTAHAVFAQNAADGKSRRVLCVQLPEPMDVRAADQFPAAQACRDAGTDMKLSEVTKERMRRAGTKIRDENPAYGGDLGFRVFKLDSGNVRPWEASRDTLAESLAAAVDHVKSDRTEDDLLYDMILKHGLDLCAAIDEKQIGSHKVRSVGGGAVFACFGSRITASDVEQLADGIAKWRDELAPANPELSRVVFRDSAFESDVAKTNLALILKERGFDEKLVVSL